MATWHKCIHEQMAWKCHINERSITYPRARTSSRTTIIISYVAYNGGNLNSCRRTRYFSFFNTYSKPENSFVFGRNARRYPRTRTMFCYRKARDANVRIWTLFWNSNLVCRRVTLFSQFTLGKYEFSHRFVCCLQNDCLSYSLKYNVLKVFERKFMKINVFIKRTWNIIKSLKIALGKKMHQPNLINFVLLVYL